MNSKSQANKLSIYNYREQIDAWKQPHLQLIKSAADNFHQKVVESQKKRSIVDYKKSCIRNCLKDSSSQEESEGQEKIEEVKEEQKIKMKETVINNEKEMGVKKLVKEWRPNIQSSFEDHEQMAKNYHDIFQNKQKLKKAKSSEKLEDFRIDQWKMVNELYQDLKAEQEPNVYFDQIIQFFQECELFYYFYNIHSYRLPNMLQEFAKKYEDKLTKQEFFDFFLIDRPSFHEYKFKTEKTVNSICVLSEEAWKDLKAIFDTLDTFGNELINIKNWFQKIKASPSNYQLLSDTAIHFPEINRTYTLQKVLFNLQNKNSFPEKISWLEITNLIKNFTHKQEPSIDKIWNNKISRGEISKDTNSFILDDKCIKQLKSIFQQCPKYCDCFVNSRLLALELLESSIIKNHYRSPTRLVNSTKNEYSSLESIIKSLSKDATEYFDLDQMLQFFSIKGPHKHSNQYFDEYDQNDLSSEQDIKKEREDRKLKKIKSLEELKKLKNNNKNKIKRFKGTKPKEFNLHKKENPTIRELKVKEMIRERELIDEIELKKKFKANSIPVALNPQRYQKYLKYMQKKKAQIFNSLNLKKEADELFLQYLKSNTKLFQEKKNKRHCQWGSQETYRFEPKPIPYKHSEDLLKKIENEKLERRNRLHDETRKKYEEKYWKNLPFSDQKYREGDSLLEQIERIEDPEKNQRRNHDVPDFQYLHQKFEEELARRKMKIKPTKIQEFNITSPKKIDYDELQRKYNSPSTQFRSRSPPIFSPSPREIKLTKKFEDWISYNQARQAEKQIAELEKEKQKEERLIKQKNFAKFMRKNLMNCTDNTAALKKKTEEKLYNFKLYIKQLEKSTEQELAEIYSRVLQRPFLFQQASELPNSPKPQQIPQKVKIQQVSNRKQYEYRPGIFDKDSQQFHPMQSQNLNQSF